MCSASREGELVETFLARFSDKSTEAVRAGFLARERAQGQSMAGEVASVAIVSRIVNVGTSRIESIASKASMAEVEYHKCAIAYRMAAQRAAQCCLYP